MICTCLSWVLGRPQDFPSRSGTQPRVTMPPASHFGALLSLCLAARDCDLTILAYSPPWRSNSSCVPFSTTLPPESTAESQRRV